MSEYGHNKKTKKQTGWNVKEPAKTSDSAVQERIDANPAVFDRMIEQKGVRAKVYRSMYCPNVKSIDGGEHEIDCQMCQGSGYIDLDSIETKVFIQTQDLEKMQGQAGYHDGNTVLGTFQIGIELQYFTLIELIDFTDIYYQRVIRKAGTDTDVLKYRAQKVHTLIDKSGARYYHDQDFKIDGNGSIKWTGTRKPADGQIYSIYYEMSMQFRAVKAMHSNRFTQYKASGSPTVEHIKLPEQWMLAKEFMVRRKDINTGNDLPLGPYDDHTDTTGDND